MKISLQLRLTPGATVRDKALWARDHGAQALEFDVWDVTHDDLYRRAEQIEGIVEVSSVCGNSAPDGTRHFDFLNPDPAPRRASIEGAKSILKFCGQVGAQNQIVPPIFGAALVPDLAPVMSVAALEDALMVAACEEIGPFAAEQGARFLLEPLNRYEQHFLNRQSDAVRVLRQVEEPALAGLGILVDFFHMNIEETDMPAAIEGACAFATQVHLADNTRLEPGTGSIDFVAGFAALRRAGFDGIMAYECGVSGDSDDEKAVNLAASISHVRELWDASA